MKIKHNISNTTMKKSTLYSVIRKIEGNENISVITTRSNAECREYLRQLADDGRLTDVKFFGHGRGFSADRFGRKFTFEIVKSSKVA